MDVHDQRAPDRGAVRLPHGLSPARPTGCGGMAAGHADAHRGASRRGGPVPACRALPSDARSAGRRGAALTCAAGDDRRLPRRPARRLRGRSVLHAHGPRPGRAGPRGGPARRCANHADGLGDPSRGTAEGASQRRARRAAAGRDRERDRDRATTRSGSTISNPTSRPCSTRSPRASTCAATCTGPRSTTSSGPRATGRASVSSGSIATNDLRREVRPSAHAFGRVARTGDLEALRA